MTNVSDEDFISTWNELKSPDKVSKKLGITLRSVYIRRRRLEKKYKIELAATNEKFKHFSTYHLHRARHMCGIRNGHVIVFSDAHFWPGLQTTAYRGLLWAIEKFKPKAVICNGDAFDGSSISRFPRIGWSHQPTVKDELLATQESLNEIAKVAKAAFKPVQLVWPLGNHDCLTPATECLTKRGWKHYQDVQPDDEILSLVDGKAVWTGINEKVEFDYNGKMIKIDKLRMQMSVTPNHRVLLNRLNWRSKQYDIQEYVRADELPYSFNIPTAAQIIQPDYPMSDDQIALASWILTDGNINEYNISIFQSKQHGREKIEAILSNLAIDFSVYERQREKMVVCGRTLLKPPLLAAQYLIKAKDTREILKWMPRKGVVPSWAYELSERQFNIFLDSIVDGDGVWDGHNPSNKTCCVIYGKEEFLASLQSVTVAHGWRSRLAQDNRGDYRLCLSKEPKIRVERKEVTEEHYEGKVWCLRVDHGNFMVRHNGVAYFTGNSRYENKLAQTAPEYEGVKGFTLKDHFPEWIPCWSCWPTDDVVIKHRYKGGIHATHQNTQSAGKNVITGHLHSLKVTPFSDYNGTRFGVDTGTLADPGGPQFIDYMEDNPANWRSGFIILTFNEGRLLWPEIVSRFDEGVIDFRGELINV